MNDTSILVVDDDANILKLIQANLTQRNYNVRAVLSGNLAIYAAQKAPPDLILLDIQMPDMNGFDVCMKLKGDETTQHIPIIFISAFHAVEEKVHAFELGGVDYVTKPFHMQEVIARVELQLHLQLQRNHIEALNVFKDELLGMVSHDLKNAIHVIQGYLSLIQYDVDDGKPFNPALLERIHSGTDKMMELVTDLLDRARGESRLPLRLAIHPLNALISTEVDLFEFQANEKSVALTFEPDTSANNEVKVNIDLGRFQQVIDNLISNALKYTDHGGRIIVRTHAENGKVLIQVADTGYGIPAADLPHIFEKFYRVQQHQHLSEDGTGLGLPIARLIIQEHGGTLIAESEIGQGSAFTITLPQA